VGAAARGPDPARRRRDTLQSEGFFFVGALAILVLSAVLTPGDTALHLFGWQLPPLCTWKALTGQDCMGCGLTRSFVWMGHGEPARAFARHTLGPILWLLLAAQVPLRAVRFWQAWRAPAHTAPPATAPPPG
jgi:hypothetical protein